MEFSAATTRTPTDWQAWAGRNVTVRDGGLELDSEPSLTVEPLSKTALDIAADADDNLYTLQESGTVSRHDDDRGTETRLRYGGDPSDPCGLCVRGDRVYVLGSGGLVAVVSARLQEPIGTIETGLEAPVTIAAADGRLYLLDGAAGAVATLQPDGSVEPVFDSLADPVDMTISEAGSIYVLEERAEHRAVQKQTSSGELVAGEVHEGRHRRLRKRAADGAVDPGAFPLSTFETADGASVTPTGVGTATDAPLLVTAALPDGSGTVILDVDPETATLGERHRLDDACRLFRTPSTAAGSSYAVVGEENRCLRLDPTETHASGPGGEFRGRAYRQFDAGSEGVQWHRLTTDREGPTAGTQLRLSYLASDDPSPLDRPLSSVVELDDSVLSSAGIATVWDLLSYEPDDLAALADHLTAADARATLDTALSAVEAATEGQWKHADAPTDCLLSAATGRYLTVRLELVGGRTASPRVQSLRADWPRQSSLDELPELYQDDPGSAAFLEQFLSVFGTFFAGVERDLETVTEYFDPAAVPAEALPWLADWVGADTPPNWPTAATRELLASAPELYRKRGTRDGLRDLLALYLRHVSPAERLPTERLVPTETSTAGLDASAVDHGLWILEPGEFDAIGSTASDAYRAHCPHARSVAVYAGPFADADHRAAVEAIIDRETPAHVAASLVELEPTLTLGADSFLGVNSRLGERRLELGGGILGNTAVLD